MAKRNMPTMTVSVTTKQRKWVEKRAKSRNSSLSEVIRAAIEALKDEQ